MGRSQGRRYPPAFNQKELLAPKVEIQRIEGMRRRDRITDHLMPAFAKFAANVATSGSDRIKQAWRGLDWLQEKKRLDAEARLPWEGFRCTPDED